eukprot:TRINITY_DN10976_c0_g1_i1.p1 TRINITY_DN10976_c0_g1~~TRINITY_DN10976_c0_g1_i1.p1  ORF type:complete len:555 (+),score=120.75 TRINITY_DN10976_c0_g1_i1:182-1846(+)
MGGEMSRTTDNVATRAERRSSKVQVSGRYNRLPKRVEDFYDIQGDVLGSGFNGSVFKARCRDNNEFFAVKSFRLVGIKQSKRRGLEREAEIFLSMDHPHVARLVDVFEDEVSLHLIMECMQGGELFDRVRTRKRFSETDAARTAYQMLLAVNYMHSQNIVHRDLKLENFMYERTESDHLKLIDFGFSHVWEPSTKMASSCGTIAYVAPEVLAKSYTSQCDMWSFGVIVFILLVGYMPFPGKSDADRVENIKAGKYTIKEKPWARVSKLGFEFVSQLLVVDHNKRLTAEQALQHTWIQCIHTRDEEREQINPETVDALCQFAKATKFRRACMSLMAWSLTTEERAMVREEFIRLDKTRKGTITLAELRTVLTDKFNVQDEETSNIFESLDTSNDEEIHYSEFLAAMVSTRIAMHDDMLLATFRRFDVDNSGYITAENLKVVLGDQYDGAKVEMILQEADESNDGRISYEEFLSYLKDGGRKTMYTEAAEVIIEREKSTRTVPQTEMQASHFDSLLTKFGLEKRVSVDQVYISAGASSSVEAPAARASTSRICSVM